MLSWITDDMEDKDVTTVDTLGAKIIHADLDEEGCI